MLKKWTLGLLLSAMALPASAVECLASSSDLLPILVLRHVSSSIGGVDSDELERALRERLASGGKYRVLLQDQYRYAASNGQIDRCTPAFSAAVQVSMNNSDPGAVFGLGGFVTRSEFKSVIKVDLLPEQVTLDEFSLNDKADTFIAGAAAGKAFKRLFESIASQFESRRDGWVRTRMPGFGQLPVNDLRTAD